MKFSDSVTSSRRKQRKAHFGAPSHERRKRMSSPLSREMRKKYNVRSLPIRVEDEVRIMTGARKGIEGRVTQVFRRKYVVHIDKVSREKANSQTVQIGIHPSNLLITNPKMNKDRKNLLQRKADGRAKGQSKITVD